MLTFLVCILISWPLITLDDEEREKLAKEISKDWNSGTWVSKPMFCHCISLSCIFFQCEILILWIWQPTYSFWAEHKHFIPDWNGSWPDADAQVLLRTKSYCAWFSSHSSYYLFVWHSFHVLLLSLLFIICNWVERRAFELIGYWMWTVSLIEGIGLASI